MIGCASMDSSWLHAVNVNVHRPPSSKRLSSCKSLHLKTNAFEDRGGHGIGLAAVGTALETPSLENTSFTRLLRGAPNSQFLGASLEPSAAGTEPSLRRLSIDSRKDTSLAIAEGRVKRSASDCRKGYLHLRASHVRKQPGNEVPLQGALVGATIDPPWRRISSTGEASRSVPTGIIAPTQCALGTGRVAEEVDVAARAGELMSAAALTSAVRPAVAKRRSSGPESGAIARKDRDGASLAKAEAADRSWSRLQDRLSKRGASNGVGLGVEVDVGQCKADAELGAGQTLKSNTPLRALAGVPSLDEIGPWATDSRTRVSRQRGSLASTTDADDDDDDVSSDAGDVSDSDDDVSSSSESDASKAAGVSARGIVILDPSTGCSDLPFRDYMPLTRLRGGGRESASIGALQRPDGSTGVWLVTPKHAGCAPTLAFSLDGGTQLLWCVRPLPLVKIVPAGNNSVKAAFKDAGFRRVTAESSRWDILWSGKALKVDDFKGLNKNQKVNHFPGTWELGRKDNLYKHLAAASRRHPAQYDFLPPVFLLPEDYSEWVEDSKRDAQQLYILKPRSSSRGRGVRLLRRPAELTKMRPSLVQKYVSNPHLINGYKYDLRLYVVVTSWDPLRVYLYQEGLVRFASEKYGLDRADLKKRCAHITNTSVNNKSASKEDGATVAAKWSLSALQAYFESEGIAFDGIWEEIRAVVLKTLIAVEGKVTSLCHAHVPHRNNCFELYGFDILLDDALKAWLLEVNTGPALHCPTALDKEIKFKLIRDTLHLVGFSPYDRDALAREEEESRRQRLLGLAGGNGKRGNGAREDDVRLVRRDWQALDDVSFAAATSGRLPLLIQEGENENDRRSDFERLYPNPDAERWAPLFESQRFNNTLYTRWLRLQRDEQGPPATRPRAATAMSGAAKSGRVRTWSASSYGVSSSSRRSSRSQSAKLTS